MAYPSSTNNVTLPGKVSRDPELRTVGEGNRTMLVLHIAVRKPGRPASEDSPTADFFSITVWGNQAEVCAKHLHKGLEGRGQLHPVWDGTDRGSGGVPRQPPQGPRPGAGGGGCRGVGRVRAPGQGRGQAHAESLEGRPG